MTGIIRSQMSGSNLEDSVCSDIVGHNLEAGALFVLLKSLRVDLAHDSVEKGRSEARRLIKHLFHFLLLPHLLEL